MQVAIIAGGLGTRLGFSAKNQPKSMVKILGEPFIKYQFEFLKKEGIDDIVLCLGHKGEQIQNYCGDGSKFGVNLKYSYESNKMDTAGAIKLAEPFLEEDFFTIYGDSYVNINFHDMYAYFHNKHKLALMSVYKNNDLYDKSNTAVENNIVTKYSKEKLNGFNFIDYGVNLFKKEVLKLLPEDAPYSLGTLFEQLIEDKELLAYEVKERFYEIGSINGLTEFTEYVRGLR